MTIDPRKLKTALRSLKHLWFLPKIEKGESDRPECNPACVEDPFDAPVEIEISDLLDLHAIPPAQCRAVVEEYLHQARSRGFTYLRIIHGKGIGVQRRMVRELLAQTPFVEWYDDAPPQAGGLGATIVTISSDESIGESG